MNIFPGWSFSRTVKKVRAEESGDGHLELQQSNGTASAGPQNPASCRDGCQSIFLGFGLGPSGKIFPSSDLLRTPRSAGCVCWNRKVISSRGHAANPTLVPWEIVRFGVIFQIVKLMSFGATVVSPDCFLLLSWSDHRPDRCSILKQTNCWFIVQGEVHGLWKLTALSLILGSSTH